MKRIYQSFILLAIVGLQACSSGFLETDPQGKVTDEKLEEYINQGGNPLQAKLDGMYSFLVSVNTLGLSTLRHDDFGHMAEMLASDLMTEDMVQTSGTYGWFFNYYKFDARSSNYFAALKPWSFYYQVIRSANEIINLVDPNVKELQSVLGQAYTMRAWSYYYLCLFYQGGYSSNPEAPAVPIVTEETRDFDNNPRASMKEVYALMRADLEKAVKLLDGYQRPSKGYIDQTVAAGVMARVCMNMEDWQAVISYTGIALNESNSQLMSRTAYLEGFNDLNNTEWMWGADITSDSPSAQTGIVNFFSHIGNLNYGYASAGNMFKIMDARLSKSIPEGDIRKECFVDEDGFVGFNIKFGPYGDGEDNFQDYVFMRRAEIILMRAEALAMSGQSPQAQNALYELVSARYPAYTKSSKAGEELREEIYQQRRVELWGEGFAFNDVKRLKKKINRDYPGSNHVEKIDQESGSKMLMYQIHDKETTTNKAIIQNP